MDLFTPVVAFEQQHPHFRRLLEWPNPYDRRVLSDWAKGLQDRDGKFVKEFQTTFNPCFWELYLHAVLRDRNCIIDFSHDRPDFCITAPTRFSIEATIASNAKNAPAETKKSGLPQDLNEFNHTAIVRLSNSISTKYRKYLKEYRALPHVDRIPFVIAVASFDQPHFIFECHRPIEALLFGRYVDEENLQIRRVRSVTKSAGVELPLGLFEDQKMRYLSAILFSSCATKGKISALSQDPDPMIYFRALRYNQNSVVPHDIRQPKGKYTEHLLSGLRIYHNPHAEHALDPSIFRHPEVFQAHFDSASKQWVYETGAHLLFRSVIKAVRSSSRTSTTPMET